MEDIVLLDAINLVGDILFKLIHIVSRWPLYHYFPQDDTLSPFIIIIFLLVYSMQRVK